MNVAPPPMPIDKPMTFLSTTVADVTTTTTGGGSEATVSRLGGGGDTAVPGWDGGDGGGGAGVNCTVPKENTALPTPAALIALASAPEAIVCVRIALALAMITAVAFDGK